MMLPENIFVAPPSGAFPCLGWRDRQIRFRRPNTWLWVLAGLVAIVLLSDKDGKEKPK